MSPSSSSTGSSLPVWTAFVLLSAFWGSSYLWIRLAVRDLSPVALVACRMLVGALVILAIAGLRRQAVRLPPGGLLRVAGTANISTVIPFLLISWGEVSVPSGLASVLNSTVPIFSVLIAGAALGDEPVTLPKLGGVVIGFAGVVLLLSHSLSHSVISWSSLGGQLAILLSSVCYAAGAVFTRRTLRNVPPMTIAVYAVCIAALETAALSLAFSRPELGSVHRETVIAILWLSMFGTGLAYSLSYFVLSRWGASRATLVAYMLPLTGLTLGAVALHETIDWRIGLGSALVVAGVGLASVTRSRRAAREASVPLEPSESRL